MDDRDRQVRRPGGAGPSSGVVAAVCLAEILGMAGYSTVPALLPQFIGAWSLTNTQGGWLAGMVFAGYMLGVLPLVGLTDHLPARVIYLASGALNALSCFGIALSDGLPSALLCRAVAGVALAGMYMPGLRALTDGVEGSRRARVAAAYTSAFTVGASLSFLLGRIGLLWGWRITFILAGIVASAGIAVAWATLPKADAAAADPQGGGPRSRNSTAAGSFRSALDIRPVLGHRDALVLIFGYAVAIWGSAGLRQWIVVFLAVCAGDVLDQGWGGLAVGALINFLGVPAGLAGNELSLRFGLRRSAIVVFLLSALVSGLFGLVAMLPYGLIVWLSLIAGFVVQGNFANLTSGVLAVALPCHTGATVALYSCIGFGGGFVGTLLFGITLDHSGGAARLAAWTPAFATCGIACLAGSVAMSFLSRDLGRSRP
jgi:predicted MFS family arabinose efflux permease